MHNDVASLRALVDVAGDGLALLDQEGRFTALNTTATDVLGLAEHDLLGRAGPFVTEPGDAARRTTTWTGHGGPGRHLEYRVLPVPESGYAVWFSDVTDVRRQRERLTAIVRAAASVADAGSLHATLDAVAQEIVQAANIAAVQILALNDPHDEVRVLGMAGFGDAEGFTERLSECRGRGAHVRFFDAIVRGETIVVPHRKPAIMADPVWAPLHEIMGYPDWDSFVSIPLVTRARTLGVINAYYKPGEDPTPGSLAFLEAMADHAAVAIGTAELLARTRSQAQLDERRRLARELHDSVVQQLFSMRMQAKALRAQAELPRADHGRIGDSAEDLADLAQGALADLRQLIFELRPLDLAEQGVVAAVRAHAASLRARSGLVVDVHTTEDLDTDVDVELQEDLYRIAQEALHNVVKHAAASRVEVRFTRVPGGGLTVEVRDDGCGADPHAAAHSGPRLGLVSMRERAERWGGTLTAGPGDGGGWRVTVTLPGRRNQ